MPSSSGPTPLECYVYEPLQSPSSIRVLDLLPSRNRNGDLECKIRQVSLGSAAATFEALSYVWGARKGSLPIRCDNKRLLVTPNCRDALIQLRQRFAVRTLWVDAICIDQDETPVATAERNRQVQMMGDIYHHAQRVLVWLGHGDSDQNLRIWRSLKLIAGIRLAEVIADDLPLKVRNASRHITKHVDRVVQTRGLRYPQRESDPTYAEFLHILENPWFFRAWTTQEVVFARRCLVMCGSSIIDWTDFTVAIKRAHALHHSTANTQLISFKDNMRDVIRFAGTEDEFSNDYNRMYDLQLLKAMCKLQCSVPSDKVYGLYSIFTARGTKMPEPDYAEPYIKVLEDFAKAYTRSRQELDVLRITLPPEKDRGLPSWLPDWFEGVAVSELTCSDVTGTRVICFDDFPSYISASRKSPACLELSPGLGKLGVRGKLVGNIRTRMAALPVGAARVGEFGLFEDFIRTCQEWCATLAAVTSYPTGEDPSLAAVRAIASHKGFAGPDIKPEDLEFWYRTMLQFRAHKTTANETQTGPKGYDSLASTGDVVEFMKFGNPQTTKETQNPDDVGRMQKVQRFINYKANYAALVLDNGYFGTAFHKCREGDQIYLLAGLGVPCVLRAVGDEFRFVALAHVYGVMRGELWPASEDELRYMILI